MTLSLTHTLNKSTLYKHTSNTDDVYSVLFNQSVCFLTPSFLPFGLISDHILHSERFKTVKDGT